MRVGVTTLGADSGMSGISQYVIALLREFARIESRGEARFEVVVHDDEAEIFAPPELGLTTITVPGKLRAAGPSLLWHQTHLPRLCQERGWEVAFLPAGNRRLPWRCPCPTVGTFHDFSILHIDGKYDALHRLYITRALPALARRLTRVLTVSQCSKDDIVSFARIPAERVDVTALGVDTARFHPMPACEARARVSERYDLVAPYVLYLSRLEHPGKNHVGLIRAFEIWKKSGNFPHQLVLAGSDWSGADSVHAAVAASPRRAEIRLPGFVAGEDIAALYAGADLLVFPSRWEGFGLPVLEAMACGVPVACSSVSSLPEVVGDAAALFDPRDPADIAGTMGRVLSDEIGRLELARRGLIRARQFTWEQTAQRTMASFRAALSIVP